MEIFDVFYKAATGLSGDGQWKIFSRGQTGKTALFQIMAVNHYMNLPVKLSVFCRISSGVPRAMIRPPSFPPPGPISTM